MTEKIPRVKRERKPKPTKEAVLRDKIECILQSEAELEADMIVIRAMPERFKQVPQLVEDALADDKADREKLEGQLAALTQPPTL
jgi:hypothetical protein